MRINRKSVQGSDALSFYQHAFLQDGGLGARVRVRCRCLCFIDAANTQTLRHKGHLDNDSSVKYCHKIQYIVIFARD